MNGKIRRVIEYSDEEIIADYSYKIVEKEEKPYGKYRKKSHFIKTFTNSGEIPKYSKRAYLADFFILSKKLSPELNLIGELTKEGWKPVQKDDLPKILGVSTSSAYRFLKESKELKIISEFIFENESYFFINPTYAFNGSSLHPLLFWLFKDCDNFVSKLSDTEKIYFDNILYGEVRLEITEEIIKFKRSYDIKNK